VKVLALFFVAMGTTGLCSCIFLSGVIFPLFFLVKGVSVSHSLIGFLGVQGVLK